MTPFGVLLKYHRLSAGLSQRALATAFGMSARMVSSLETGKTRPPRGGRLRQLADLLGLRDEQRMQFAAAAMQSNYRPEIPTDSSPRNVALVNDLVANLKRLTESHYTQIRQVIKESQQ